MKQPLGLTDRALTEDRIIDELPGWVSGLMQLNVLIAERMGLVVTDLQCLHALRQLGPSTAGELAVRVGLTPGAASRMIDRLEVAACVRRTPDPDDRRRVVIEATEAGLGKVAAHRNALARGIREALADLGDDQTTGLLAFLRTSHLSVGEELAMQRP